MLQTLKLRARPVRQAIAARLEARSLKAVRTIPCSADALIPAARIDATKFLRSTEIDRIWNESCARLSGIRIPDQSVGVNAGDGRALFHIASYFQPCMVLEIGTGVGASTLHLAAALRRNGRGRLLSVDLVDTNASHHSRTPTRPRPIDRLSAAGCSDVVEFIVGRSRDVLRGTNLRFDLVFIDGDHSAAAVYEDLASVLNGLRPDGVIVLHDYFPGMRPLWSDRLVIPGPALAVQRLRAEGVSVEALPLASLPWPTKHASSATSLAMLGRQS